MTLKNDVSTDLKEIIAYFIKNCNSTYSEKKYNTYKQYIKRENELFSYFKHSGYYNPDPLYGLYHLNVPPKDQEFDLKTFINEFTFLIESYKEICPFLDIVPINLFTDDLSASGILTLNYDIKSHSFTLQKTVYGTERILEKDMSFVDMLTLIRTKYFYTRA